MISFCVFFGNKRHMISTGMVWRVWTIGLDSRGGRTSGGAGGAGGGGDGGDGGNDSGPRVIVRGDDGKITTLGLCLRRLTAQYIKKRIITMVKSPAIGRRTRQAVRSVSCVAAVGMVTVVGI